MNVNLGDVTAGAVASRPDLLGEEKALHRVDGTACV